GGSVSAAGRPRLPCTHGRSCQYIPVPTQALDREGRGGGGPHHHRAGRAGGPLDRRGRGGPHRFPGTRWPPCPTRHRAARRPGGGGQADIGLGPGPTAAPMSLVYFDSSALLALVHNESTSPLMRAL